MGECGCDVDRAEFCAEHGSYEVTVHLTRSEAEALLKTPYTGYDYRNIESVRAKLREALGENE